MSTTQRIVQTSNIAGNRRSASSSERRFRAACAIIAVWIGLQITSWFLPSLHLGLFLLEPLAVGMIVLSLGVLLLWKSAQVGDFLFLSCLVLCFWRLMFDSAGPNAYVFDDGFMFTRYARNALSLGQIAWNPDGIPTYGLTSPLYLSVALPVQALLSASDPEWTTALASRLSAIAFLATFIVLLWSSLSLARSLKQTAVALVLVSMLRTETLALNAGSGMDTAFAMWMLTAYFLMVHQWTKRKSRTSGFAVALLGGLLFWVRPEYSLFALLVPVSTLFMGQSRQERISAVLCLGGTAAVLGAVLLANQLYFGTALPLPYYAKSAGLYDDPALLDYHRPVPFVMLVYFAIDYAPFVIIALITLFRAPRHWLKAQPVYARGILAATLLLTGYYFLFVLQIMYFLERYYHHLLPAVAFLSALMLAFWLAPERLGRRMTGLWERHRTTLFVAIGALMGVWSVAWLLSVLPAENEFAGMSRLDAARTVALQTPSVSTGQDSYYPGFFELARVNKPLVIASTEVGRLSVLNPDFTILDIAGLNDRSIVFSGFSPDWLVAQAPDLMYLPHPHYDKTNEELLNSEAFLAQYEVYTGEQLKSLLGVAIRKEGPYSEELMRWVNRVLQVVG